MGGRGGAKTERGVVGGGGGGAKGKSKGAGVIFHNAHRFPDSVKCQ